MEYSVNFDGGAVEKIRTDSNNDIHFSIRPDPVGAERLWFYFRVTSPNPIRPWFILDTDPAKTHQPNWGIVRPLFSADGTHWVRAEEVSFKVSRLSRLFGGKPVFRFRSPLASKTLWVAYSYPYTARDLERFLKTLELDHRVRLLNLGRSEEGRTIPRIAIEAPRAVASPPLQEIWIVCREHPGETPASFVLEGFIKALLEQPVGQRLLSKYRFHILPMLNVDGVTRGNYYRNSTGIDIAQDWGSFKSSEVRSLYEAMRNGLESGRVGLVFDLHSANHPESHFLLETPEHRLSVALRNLQRRLIQTSNGVHPQLQTITTIKLWDFPVIAGNYLSAKYGVYVFYSESNYNVGIDGTVVTPESLRALGAAFARVLSEVLVENR